LRRRASEVVIAVSGLTDTIVASNDDVGLKRVASAVCSIGVVGWAGEDAGCLIVYDLSTCDSNRSSSEEYGIFHVELFRKVVD
jgi:hypothetical protein